MGRIGSVGLVLAGVGQLLLYSDYWLTGIISLVAGVWGLVALDIAKIVSRAAGPVGGSGGAGEVEEGSSKSEEAP